MAGRMKEIDIYIEAGAQRVIAGAIEWPGWCRIARDEAAARQALFDYAARYARVLSTARLDFHVPADADSLVVVERLKGDSTTDFGAPAIAPARDRKPLDPAELDRLEMILKACWQAFDAAVRAAKNKVLAKGPRGGGRDLGAILEHVIGADAAYLSRLGWKMGARMPNKADARLALIRRAMLDGLAAGARGELPTHGPRGGKIWTPRYFVRRVAWHVLDHAWEIEDRAAARK